jgi:2'-5' RNA ligase
MENLVMALLVLAYPEIAPSNYERIQEFRKLNDELYYHVVEPHFTLVFPLPGDWKDETLITEIEKQIRGIQQFEFCIRCAALNKDAFSDTYHTFLVPDEGYSNILKLHDKLYSEKLFPHRKLQVDYIPHMGIGNSKDPLRCLEMVEYWNKTEFATEGRIAILDVANYENDSVQTIQRIYLGE